MALLVRASVASLDDGRVDAIRMAAVSAVLAFGATVVTYDTVGHLLFSHHCDGLIDAVQRAARPISDLRGAWGEHLPYYGDVVGVAVWQAQFVYREARRLGLIEDPIDVLVRLDVEAGEPVEHISVRQER